MAWNFILYLVYGLAFFTLGVAILSRDTRFSELGIARILWLLAVFGIIHGLHEWLELLAQLIPSVNGQVFFVVRLIILSTSFLFLIYFGLFLNIITIWGDQALKTTPAIMKMILALAALSLILLAIYLDIGRGKDLDVRRLVAFPGGLLSGIGLIMYSRTVRSFSKKVARNFILAGGFMMAFSVFTGVIPSDTIIPVLETKIILLRGASAFLIMFFTIRALSVFSIEQRELINEQLLRFSQSEKLTSMGIMAAGIAHEINNPLTNASLNLEMLKDLVGKQEARVDKKLESIDRNISRASKIAAELLQFSRETETAFERVDLNEVIRSSARLIEYQEFSSVITLDLRDVPEVMGISHKLEEVFINVLMNSIDACTEGDSIVVETLSDGLNVIARISDTGHGVDPEKISQVFDPFFTTKEVGKGTGLGLSVCYNIIKNHWGDVSIANRNEVGVVVTITIPLAEDDA
jgi:signal transduction histidine kinase